MKKTLTIIATTLIFSACGNNKTETQNLVSDSVPTDTAKVEMPAAQADTIAADTVAATESISDQIAKSTPIKFTGSKKGTEDYDGEKVTFTYRATLTLNADGKCKLYEMVQDDMTSSGTYTITDSTIVMKFPNRWDGKTITGTISSDLSKISLKESVAAGIKTLRHK